MTTAQASAVRPPACVPLQLRFPAHPTSVRHARQAVIRAAHDGLLGPAAKEPELPDTLCLLVSELVTNAITHAPTRDRVVEVTVWTADGCLWLAVADSGPGIPLPRRPTSDSTHGRGLLLVDALADIWGVLPRLAGPGKVVFAGVRTGPAE